MAKEYIDKEAFVAEKRMHYCAACNRRQGMKNGKMQFCYEIGDAPCRACDVADMLDYIEDFPAADVAPVVRGRWVHGEYGPYCSNCDGYPPTRKRLGHPGDTEFDYTKFCPNCGAKMDGGQDDA